VGIIHTTQSIDVIRAISSFLNSLVPRNTEAKEDTRRGQNKAKITVPCQSLLHASEERDHRSPPGLKSDMKVMKNTVTTVAMIPVSQAIGRIAASPLFEYILFIGIPIQPIYAT
jgi:hypothetical protein